MKLTIPRGLTQFASKAALNTKQKSPTLLFAAGVVGFGTTVVLASKATLHLDEVLGEVEANRDASTDTRERHPESYTEAKYNQDQRTIRVQGALKIAKLYMPAVIVGAASVACLTKSHQILNKRNAAITAAYGGLLTSFTNYRERVRGEFGDEKDLEFAHGKQMKDIGYDDGKGVKIVAEGRADENVLEEYQAFFDPENPNWDPAPELNFHFLMAIQKRCQRQLERNGHLFLNDVYDRLGMERTSTGAIVGWVLKKDKPTHVDFGLYKADTDPCERVEFLNLGRACKLEFNCDGLVWDLLDKIKRSGRA